MWDGEICHINAARDGCDALEGLPALLVPNMGLHIPEAALVRIPIPGTAEFLRLGPGYSLRFHGDFHDVAEDTLHARHVVVGTSSVGDQPRTAFATAWFSGGYYDYALGTP